MFYSYADKQGEGFFGSWQLRQIAFDTMRRYLYYSEPTKDAVPIAHTDANTATMTSGTVAITTTTSTSLQPSNPAERESATAVAAESICSPSRLVWKKKMKVTAVVPVATSANFVHRTGNERDLYQLEIKGESRHLATGEYPPAGPLLCPSAGLSTMERARCNASNEAYIRDPFFLKELFDALRDQFDEMARARVLAAASAATEEGGGTDANNNNSSSNSPHGGGEGGANAVNFGVQTLISPRRQKTEAGMSDALTTAAVVPMRVILRCRDEREFRRLWYLLQTVLGYDKLIVRPYRGLPPYDPRNGVAFAHIPMAVWHTFKALDKAVFYTFMRGNFYALGRSSGDAPPTASNGSRSQLAALPKLKRVLDVAYLCITHDSVLCMRESGNIPRWLRLAEVQEFHWDVVAKSGATKNASPFCVFLSDAPIPDLFFEPTAPAYGADSIASYDPLVDVRRIAHVIHDTCFASFSIRRVIRIKEVADTSMEAYVARTVREGTRLPALQTGSGINSTLSCPLPKEQLAVVWQQVQSELLERGNMANRAAIPIYRTNARDVELSEDQLSAVERELEDERERGDDVVGMPLERARQLERRRRGSAKSSNNANRTRQRHRDVNRGIDGGAASRESSSAATATGPTSLTGASYSNTTASTTTTTTTTQVMPLTIELLQTPQLQGRFATTITHLQGHAGGARSGVGSKSERSDCSSPDASTAAASEYSSYLVPGARYLTQEEWQSCGYTSPASPLSAAAAPASAVHAVEAETTAAALPLPLQTPASANGDSGASRAPATSSQRDSGASSFAVEVSRGASVAKATSAHHGGGGGGADRRSYAEERTVNEIVGRSMAALDGSRVDLDQMDKTR
jgi:hypothetical protein